MSETAVAEPTFAVIDVAVDAIVPNPRNPRPKLKPAEIASLAASIEVDGLLHPVTVCEGKGGKYQLLAGHRRLAAFQYLKRAMIPARVVAGGEQRALEILLVENEQRRDLDPIQESDLVAELLEKYTREEVASTLGRSVGWVARRANLRSLSKGVRAAREPGKPLAEWPTIWLEELALLSHDAQDRLVETQKDERTKIVDARVLRHLVRSSLHTLERAPWKLDDANVAPGCGACVGCPKHSQANPGLFGDDAAPKDLNKATCLDTTCFDRKLQAWTDASAAAARAKHGDALVLVEGRELPVKSPRADVDWRIAQDAQELQFEMEDDDQGAAGSKKNAPKLLQHYQVDEVKKGTKGAVPALVVSGSGAGTVKWIKKPGEKATERTQYSQPRASKSAGPKSMAEKLRDLEARRKKHVVEAVHKYVEDLDGDPRHVKDDAHLLSLVATWGCASTGNADGPAVPKAKVHKVVFEGVAENILEELGHARFGTTHAVALYPVAQRLCETLGISFAERVSAAELAIPEPKSWAAEKSAAAASKKQVAALAKKLDGKNAKKGAKPAPKRDKKSAAAGERDED